MRKRVILAFMLVFALVAASSCSLIIKDEEVDKQTPIIEVVGKTFTKAEVNEQVEAVMDYEEYMYSMYGISYDRTDASTISMAQDSAIDAMVQQAVLEKKAADLGLDVLSDEEKAEVEESVDSTYTLYSDSVKSAYFCRYGAGRRGAGCGRGGQDGGACLPHPGGTGGKRDERQGAGEGAR